MLIREQRRRLESVTRDMVDRDKILSSLTTGIVGGGIKAAKLRQSYRKMAGRRVNKARFWGKVPEGPVIEIAGKLKSVKLAELYVEAQFDAMPPDWCREKFGKPYPPPNVVFGGEAWRRYEEYLQKGVRDAG